MQTASAVSNKTPQHVTSPEAETSIAIVDDIEMGGSDTDEFGEVQMGDDDDAGATPAELTPKPICVRLFEEPRGWWHSCEVDYMCEASGDVNLDALAKLLPVEGSVRVSITASL